MPAVSFTPLLAPHVGRMNYFVRVIHGTPFALSAPLAGVSAPKTLEQQHRPSIKGYVEIPVDFDAYASLLQACTDTRALKQVHSLMLARGLEQNVDLGVKLMSMYTMCGSMVDARLLLEKMTNPDVAFWNAMMREYSNKGFYQESLRMFYQMARAGVEPDNFTFPCVLKACAGLSALEEGKKIHGIIIRGGFESHNFVGSALVGLYAKCGSLEDGRQVFDRIPQRDAVTWNAMIAGYVQNGHCYEALKFLNEMQLAGVNADPYTAASALPACGRLAALQQGMEIHAFIIRRGFECDAFVGSALIDMYAKCGYGSINVAHRVFDKMCQRTLVSWNAMIGGYAQNGCCQEAFALFCQMQSAEIKPNSVTTVSVLFVCAQVGALQRGMEIHSHIIRKGFESDVFVRSALVAMYAKCGSMENAHRVFDKMSQREVVAWNAMIAGYSQNGHFDNALKLCSEMRLAGLKSDPITIASVLPACAHLAALQLGKEIHSYIIRNGFDSNVHVGSALATMYAKCGRAEDAYYVFDRMFQRDVVSWSAIISGYAQSGHHNQALRLFQQMQLESLKPDSDTTASILSACAHLTALKQGKEIHDYIIKNGIAADVFVGSALVDMYAKCGSIEFAQHMFDNMIQRNVVSWNAMIVGYCQNGHSDEALKLFREMQWTEVKPDLVTIASVLPACASLAALQQGKEIHTHIVKCRYESDGFVGNALTDMYAKCGSIEIAHKYFDKMPERDAVAWNVMIGGYGAHGRGQDALALFQQMQEAGVVPDDITFVAVLSACSHAGLVDEGWKYFVCMSQEYCITPRMEHFACMVDLLGRAGCLDEAHDFIKNMPLEPDASVWGALLGACRLHCNTELGECAAQYLFELEPEHAGYYVLLSNIYAAESRWDDAAKVRLMMKDKRLKKNPGCSWIKVENRVHVFVVGDRSHPESENIYATLKILYGQMKEAGYLPDRICAWQDMEED